tara:strand:+ start:12353 stop:13030 length:678 start_codon:yes stop_codon:yes gene_type:complete
MASFDQAYWYTNACPLRKLTKRVISKSDIAELLETNIAKSFITIFDQKNIEPTTILKDLKLKSPKRGVRAESLVTLLEQCFINYGIWKLKHIEGIIIDKNIIGTIKNLDFQIDIARLKTEGTRIQLIWFNYEVTIPSIDSFIKLVQAAQWNARGFELSTGNLPMQLTYFFPALGIEYSVLYNTYNNYDVIAKLIEDNVYYTKPSSVCDICNECPMTWAGYQGTLL